MPLGDHRFRGGDGDLRSRRRARRDEESGAAMPDRQLRADGDPRATGSLSSRRWARPRRMRLPALRAAAAARA